MPVARVRLFKVTCRMAEAITQVSGLLYAQGLPSVTVPLRERVRLQEAKEEIESILELTKNDGE